MKIEIGLFTPDSAEHKNVVQNMNWRWGLIILAGFVVVFLSIWIGQFILYVVPNLILRLLEVLPDAHILQINLQSYWSHDSCWLVFQALFEFVAR